MNPVLFFIAAFFSGVVVADGMVIDKIYHPYVQESEQELEFR